MTELEQRMRADLTVAMRSRDRDTVRVLRSTLAAIANAEAQPSDDSEPTALRSAGGIAGASSGLGATDVSRRVLTVDDVHGIVADERRERLDSADDLAERGAAEPAAALRAEAAILDDYLLDLNPG